MSTFCRTVAWSSAVAAGLLAAALAAASEPLVLDADSAARLAVEVSALVDAADARIESSQLAVTAADAERLPVVRGVATVAQRNAVPELAIPIGGPGSSPRTLFPSIETTYRAELAVAQPLYSGGAISSGREAARHDLDSAKSSRRRSLLDLRFAARSLYWETVAADAGLAAAEAQERRAQRLLEDARALLDAGMGVWADVLAGEARAAAARVEVVRAMTAVRQTLARLRSLLAVTDDTEIQLVDRRTGAVPPGPPMLERLVEEALASRPELAIVDAGIAAFGAEERTIDAARRPALGVEAMWDLSRPNPRYLPLEDRWNDSWAVGVTASWTLFDGQRTRSRAATVRAERDALRADREELARKVTLEVETDRLTMAAALEAVAAADAAEAAARAREEAARERYQAGLAPMLEMLDAQMELADAERSKVLVRATAWIAAAALERSVGR
jgi:outer membrane protein TolC